MRARQRSATDIATQLPLAGLITPSRFVDIVSTSVAQTFGIYPRKGVIAAGSDADVIIFNPAAEHTISAASHHSRMDTNIYEGKGIRGKVPHFRTVNSAILQPDLHRGACCM